MHNRYDLLNIATTEELFYEVDQVSEDGQQVGNEMQGLKATDQHG